MSRLLPRLLLPAPAVFLGALAMALSGVSFVLWGQQLAALAVFFLLSLSALPLRRRGGRLPAAALCALLLLLLAASLLSEGAGGARRWISLRVLSVNAALLVLPALLILLPRLKTPYPALLAAALILALQPDAAQLFAFALAALAPQLSRRDSRRIALLCAPVLLALLGLCAARPVSLDPVPYCEGILSLLGARSPLLFAAGVLALAAVPLFFARRFARHRQAQSLSLPLYYAAAILPALFGAVPVPLMGFGLSPIAGYFLAAALLPD